MKDPRPRNAALNALTWDYSTGGNLADIDSKEVLQEINGWTFPDKTLVPGFAALKNDGSTACGCWIYSGVFPNAGENRAAQREPTGAYGQGWGFAWPSDRRIIYNRASARPDGKPWSERKKLVWWDAPGKSGPGWIHRTLTGPSRQITNRLRTPKVMRLLPEISRLSCIRTVSGGFGSPPA
jgi:formate dehydrogenase major subunit